MNPLRHLQQAAQLASTITAQDYLLAAVGVRADGTRVQASNKAVRAVTMPGQRPDRLWNTHAEMRLCRKLDGGSIVFVARVLKDGAWAMARPCVACMNRLRQQHVIAVFFTTAPGEYDSIAIC